MSQYFQCSYDSVYLQTLFLACLSQSVCFSLESKQVNAAGIHFYGGCRKCTVGNQEIQEKGWSLWGNWYIGNGHCNTSGRRADGCWVQCICNCACVEFPYTTRFGIRSKLWGSSCHATPCNMHTSTLSWDFDLKH